MATPKFSLAPSGPPTKYFCRRHCFFSHYEIEVSCVTAVLKESIWIGCDWHQLRHTFLLSISSTVPLCQAALQMHLHLCSPKCQKSAQCDENRALDVSLLQHSWFKWKGHVRLRQNWMSWSFELGASGTFYTCKQIQMEKTKQRAHDSRDDYNLWVFTVL